MADAQSHPRELVTPQMSDQVAQAIVTAMSASLFQPHRAQRQVQVIVRDQDRRRRNSMKARQRRDRLPAAVHEGHRLQQPQILSGQRNPTGLAVVFRIGAKLAAVLTSQFVH
jgi:hypothetical protein